MTATHYHIPTLSEYLNSTRAKSNDEIYRELKRNTVKAVALDNNISQSTCYNILRQGYAAEKLKRKSL